MVLSIPLGWLAVQLKWIHDRHEALKWYEQNGCGPRPFPAGWFGWAAPWSIRILGERGYGSFIIECDEASATDEERERVIGKVRLLFPEAAIRNSKPSLNSVKDSGDVR